MQCLLSSISARGRQLEKDVACALTHLKAETVTQKWAYAARTIATGALAAAQLLTACSRTSYHLTSVVGSAQQTYAGRCKQQQTTRHANFQNTCKKTNCCPRQPRDLHCRKGFATANQVHSSTSQHKSTAKPITSFQEAACTGQLDSLSLPKCGAQSQTRHADSVSDSVAEQDQATSGTIRVPCRDGPTCVRQQDDVCSRDATYRRPGSYTQNHHHPEPSRPIHTEPPPGG